MMLDQYYIPFADHTSGVDVATEGFFMDDKNPTTSTTDNYGNGCMEIIKYKNVQLPVVGPKWATVFVESHSKTTEGFKKSGLQFLNKVVNEALIAEQYVKANSAKYREAIASKNTEVINNLAEGIRKCFPTLLDYTHAANRGNNQFGGAIVPMDNAFKVKLTDTLVKFQRIYRDAAILLAKNYIAEHASKSTLKKIFRHTLSNYNAANYLESELFAYCKDIHVHVQETFYS